MVITPKSQMVTSFALKVTEFRGGQMVGYVIRDYQAVSVIGNNFNPVLSGLNNGTLFNTTIYLTGGKYCFSITASDKDANTLTVSSDAVTNLPGSTFIIKDNQINPVSGLLCWEPDASQVDKTFCFTVTVVDDGCKDSLINGTDLKGYCITVKSKPPPILPPPTPQTLPKKKTNGK